MSKHLHDDAFKMQYIFHEINEERG